MARASLDDQELASSLEVRQNCTIRLIRFVRLDLCLSFSESDPLRMALPSIGTSIDNLLRSP